MAIDLSALQLPQAVLTRSPGTTRSYRLDEEKARAALQAAREAGEPQDLLELSGVTARDMAQLQADRGQQGVITVISNYGSETFFHRDMPEVANQDGTYTVRGVKFSADELQEAKAVMQKAADSISAGPGRNTNLDYRNYAQMAIAQNAVDTYAASHFGKEQADVLSRAMGEYNEALVNMQNALLGSSEDTSAYYGKTHILSQDEADMLNAFKKELSALTGQSFRLSHAGDSGGYDQIATNRTRIEDISSLFAGADLTQSAGRNAAMQKYASLMRPVYLAQGISAADLNRVISQDTSKLLQGFDSILHAAVHVNLGA